MNMPLEQSIPQNSMRPQSEMILVTGASGFLGRHLVRHLAAQGHTVRALYHKTAPDQLLLNLEGVSWQQCDLLDVYDVEDAMQGVARVYHCAAIVSFHPADRDSMLHFNVESTTNIVNEALETGVRKLVFVSSVAALGRSEKGKELTEEEQWEESRYNSRYGLSKHLAELEVWRGMAEGMDGVVVNPTVILGPGNWNEGSARLMTVVDEEFPFYTQGINGWVDVEDVVTAMVRLMESDISGERFIVSAGNYPYREIFTKMALALGKKPPRIKAGKFLTGLVWRWNMIRSSLFGKVVTVTKETANTAQRQTFYNNSKLFRYLEGYQYRPIDQTIGTMAAAFVADKKKK